MSWSGQSFEPPLVHCGRQPLLFHGTRAEHGPHCSQASCNHQGVSPRRQATVGVKERGSRKKSSPLVIVAISDIHHTSGLSVSQWVPPCSWVLTQFSVTCSQKHFIWYTQWWDSWAKTQFYISKCSLSIPTDTSMLDKKVASTDGIWARTVYTVINRNVFVTLITIWSKCYWSVVGSLPLGSTNLSGIHVPSTFRLSHLLGPFHHPHQSDRKGRRMNGALLVFKSLGPEMVQTISSLLWQKPKSRGYI